MSSREKKKVICIYFSFTFTEKKPCIPLLAALKLLQSLMHQKSRALLTASLPHPDTAFFIVYLITGIIPEGFKTGVGIKAELLGGICEFHWIEI